jgi:hypothetical protein
MGKGKSVELSQIKNHGWYSYESHSRIGEISEGDLCRVIAIDKTTGEITVRRAPYQGGGERGQWSDSIEAIYARDLSPIKDYQRDQIAQIGGLL